MPWIRGIRVPCIRNTIRKAQRRKLCGMLNQESEVIEMHNGEKCDNCNERPHTHGTNGVDGIQVMLCATCVETLQNDGELPNVEVE